MIISNGKKIDKADIRNLWDECFDEDSKCWRNWYFDNVFNENNVLGVKEGGKLISMIHMNPYTLMMRGSRISAFALAGVATQKEHRNIGLAGNLIKYGLKRAYQQGHLFSFLYPFEYKYYEKFGYKLSYNNYTYSQIYTSPKKPHFFKVIDIMDAAEMSVLYNKMTANLNGYVVRDKDYYNTHIQELMCDNDVIYFSFGVDSGYFAINNEKDTVEEIVFDGDISEAMEVVCSYYKKNIVFKNLFDVEKNIGTKKSHCMGRVVSVEKIFRVLKMKKNDIKIKITDKIIEENNGTWHIIYKDGAKTQVKRTEAQPDYSIDISQLAPIITGYEFDENSTEYAIQTSLFKCRKSFIFEVC